MRRGGAPVVRALVVVGIAVAIGVGCSDDEPQGAAEGPLIPTVEWGDPDDEPVEGLTAATRRGIDALARQLDEVDTVDLAIAVYLHRNWRLDGLSDAPVAALERVGTRADVDVDELLARRLVDPEQGPPTSEEAQQHVIPEPGSIFRPLAPMVRVLYCDVIEMGADDVALLREGIAARAYPATNVALALSWADELGCAVPERDALHDEVTDTMAADLGSVEPAAEHVDVLTVQIASVLHHLGGRDRIDSGWVEAVVDAQLDDGSWPGIAGDTEPSPDATMRALWFLLQVQDEGAGVPIVRSAG